MDMLYSRLRPAKLFVALVIVFSLFSAGYILKGSYSGEEFEQEIREEIKVPIVEVELPIIYAVTPTYKRTTQLADMTRLSHTLSLVPNLHWLIVEDEVKLSDSITNLVRKVKINYTHIIGPTPANKKLRKFGKGVAPRLKALEWIKKNVKEGILYFADDDNAYDLEVFEEMRSTKKVAVFPVGCIAGIGLSSPIIRNHKVVGFHDPFHSNRLFAVDMAGFSVNIKFLLSQKNVTLEYRIGYIEDTFLRSLNITLDDLEPKANECTKVLTWHTKTMKADTPSKKNLQSEKNYNDSNLPKLYAQFL